jgi:hypothetical protein
MSRTRAVLLVLWIGRNENTRRKTMPEFKRGDWVEVRDNMAQEWCRRIYLTTIEGINCPICTVSECDADAFMEGKIVSMTRWNYVRAVRPPFKIDDKVLVRSKGDVKWFRRHFAEWGEDGKIKAYPSGLSSWTSGDWNPAMIPTYDEYKLP